MNERDPALAYLSLPWSWDIQYDAEDECWVATIKELPDFFAAGKNAADAARNSREALLSHLRGYLTSGTTVPTPARPKSPEPRSATEDREVFVVAA